MTSKEDLANTNERLVDELELLKTRLADVHELLQYLQSSFIKSKDKFSISRYGDFKKMIKNVTSDEILAKVNDMNEGQKEKHGCSALLQNAKDFSSVNITSQETVCRRENIGNKFSKFVKMVQNATGLSNKPSDDIRNLDKCDIQKDNERLKREIRRIMIKRKDLYSTLSKLKQHYEDSKAYAPHLRYQKLKDMIKELLLQDNYFLSHKACDGV